MTSPTKTRLLALPAVLLLGLLLAACGGGNGGPVWTYAPLGPTPLPATPSPDAGESPGGSPDGSPSGNVIELEMTGDLRILQGGEQVTELRLTEGEEYTFRVTNSAGFDHNFHLGPAERLAANDVADLPGLGIYQSGTQEFTWTPTAAEQGWQFACTVPGHYQPMHGELIIEP
jgi:hypothetical protein